jgi:predicted  nucleic acid-binding Zn-ribbon protein
MLKKIVVGTVAAAALGGVIFGTDAYSYVTTSAKKFRTEVKANVPLDFEIERARNMVAELIPDIQQNMHIIAQEEVEVDDLRDQIARSEKNLSVEKQKLLTLCSDIGNTQGKFHYSHRLAKPGEVKGEVARRFERFQTAEATLKAKKQMLEARERSLIAAREKLEGMFSAKRDLEVEVQNLEARLKMLQAAQTTSQFNFDDSQLSRCKKTMQELRKRLDIAERILDQDGKLIETLSEEASAPVAEDIVEQVQTYFNVHESSGNARASL